MSLPLLILVCAATSCSGGTFYKYMPSLKFNGGGDGGGFEGGRNGSARENVGGGDAGEVDMSTHLEMPHDLFLNNSTHVLCSNLINSDCILDYRIYKRVRSTPYVIMSRVDFGKRTTGHPGVIHGGLTSMILDDLFGYAYFVVSSLKVGYTGSLNVKYLSKIKSESSVIIKVYKEASPREGSRKVNLKAVVEDCEGRTLVEAEAIYIVDKAGASINVKDPDRVRQVLDF